LIITGFVYYQKNKLNANKNERETPIILDATPEVKTAVKIDPLTEAYQHFQTGNMSETLRFAQESLREKLLARFQIDRNENSRLVMLNKMNANGLNEAEATALIELQNAIGQMRFTGLYPDQQQVKNILGVIERL